MPKATAQPQCEPLFGNGAGQISNEKAMEIGAKQEVLRPDLDIVRQYGAAHADEYSGEGFLNEDGDPVLVAWFTGHLDEHLAALKALVAHPERVRTKQGVNSGADVSAMADEFHKDPRFQTTVSGNSGGSSGPSPFNIDFFATKVAREAAEYARQKYGTKACISIAGHPYPRGAWADPSECRDLETTDTPADIEVEFIDEVTVARGDVASGTMKVTNKGDAPWNAMGGGKGFAAAVVQRGTDERVAGFNGGVTLEGRTFTAAPGETIDVPYWFGTDDCRPELNYSLPPGEYDIVLGDPFPDSVRQTITVTE